MQNELRPVEKKDREKGDERERSDVIQWRAALFRPRKFRAREMLRTREFSRRAMRRKGAPRVRGEIYRALERERDESLTQGRHFLNGSDFRCD